MKKSACVSFAGIAAALSFVLLYLGSVMWIFAYTAPLICSVLMMAMQTTFGKKYALSVFITTAFLSLLFSPDKEAALVYTFFFGYYPLVREQLEKIKPRVLSFFVKLLLFNAGITASQLLLIYAFGIPLDNDFGKWGIPLFFALFNLLFFTFEKLYGVLLGLYVNKLEKLFSKLLK